ncbi:MAG: hypothetical protein J4G10_05350 [Alphaproteobacteria bacterium]|nr:hypothetical protein [Alphaproteobacteria bacterium]
MKRDPRGLPEHRAVKALPVLVIFSDQTDLPWLRLLKRGYRHCFLVILQGTRWLVYDPLVHRTEIIMLDLPPDFDLADWYRQHGLRVIATKILPAASRFPACRMFLPLRPFTCVEAVKRVLGLRAAQVFTPWQLYQHLDRHDPLAFIFPLDGR